MEVTGQNVDKPKRRRLERRQTKTSTYRNVDRPKCRQAKTSTERQTEWQRERQTDHQTTQKWKRRSILLSLCEKNLPITDGLPCYNADNAGKYIYAMTLSCAKMLPAFSMWMTSLCSTKCLIAQGCWFECWFEYILTKLCQNMNA